MQAFYYAAFSTWKVWPWYAYLVTAALALVVVRIIYLANLLMSGAVLARLAAATGSTAHLGVLHGPQTLYLLKERPPGSTVSLVTDVGVRLPAALTATGLSILADLSSGQVRALFPDAGVALKPLGDAFVRLIRLALAPIIFGTVVVGMLLPVFNLQELIK